jgi:hypothetical protein
MQPALARDVGNAAIRETNPGAAAVRHPANAHVNEARYEGESENLQLGSQNACRRLNSDVTAMSPNSHSVSLDRPRPRLGTGSADSVEQGYRAPHRIRIRLAGKRIGHPAAFGGDVLCPA